MLTAVAGLQQELVLTDGLEFHLDVLDRSCYKGQGTAVTELVGSNLARLVNGPVYDNDNGCMSFDGSNDYMAFNVSPGTGEFNPPAWETTFFTVEVWFRTDSTINDGNYGCLVGNGNPFQMYQVADDKIELYLVNGGFFVSGKKNDTAITDDVWNHYVLTRTDDGEGNSDSSTYVHYLNGAADGTFTSNSNTCRTSDNQGIHIGNTWSTNANFCFGGDIGPVRVYDHALTATEVVHNFNAQRHRFGV